jgi:structural maintenance of chromosome 4
MEDEQLSIGRRIQEIRNLRRELHDEQRELTKRHQSIESSLPKIRVEIDGFGMTRTNLVKSIPNLQAQCELSKTDEKKLKELRDNVKRCENEMSSCSRHASEIEKEVDELQAAILDAGGPKLKKQQQRYDKVVRLIEETQGRLNTAKVQITSSQKVISQAKTAVDAGQHDLEKCLEDLQVKGDELTSLEKDALRVKEAYERVKIIESEKRSELDELASESDSLSAAQSELKCKEIELVGKLDEVKKQIHENDRKREHWANLIEKLKNAVEEEDRDGALSDDDDDDGNDDGDNDDDDEVEKQDDEVEDERKEIEEDVDNGEDGDGDGDGDSISLKDGNTKSLRSDRTKGKTRSDTLLPVISDSVLDKYDKSSLKNEIATLESERNNMAKNANMGAIAEYRKKEADYLSR